MKQMLLMMGVDVQNQVDICIQGKEALEQVKYMYRMKKKYHLIITDFNMPVMDRIESTRLIRQFLKEEIKLNENQFPIIIGLTGHVEERYS